MLNHHLVLVVNFEFILVDYAAFKSFFEKKESPNYKREKKVPISFDGYIPSKAKSHWLLHVYLFILFFERSHIYVHNAGFGTVNYQNLL